jgi:hypothetical protein
MFGNPIPDCPDFLVGGKLQVRSSGSDENRAFLEGDVLEVAVRNGPWMPAPRSRPGRRIPVAPAGSASRRSSILLELGLGGKFQAKSSGWDENRTFLEGDVLEVEYAMAAGC